VSNVSNMGIEDKLIEYIMSHYEESIKVFRNINEQVYSSDLNDNGKCIHTIAVPKVFSNDDLKRFEDFISK